MCNIAELKREIEKLRKEVSESLENNSFEASYEKNKKLDKLIEVYLDVVEETTIDTHLSSPQSTTNE